MQKEKIKQATTMSMIRTTIKLFEQLCPKCRINIWKAGKMKKRTGIDNAENIMKKALGNLCPVCKAKHEAIINKTEGKQ